MERFFERLTLALFYALGVLAALSFATWLVVATLEFVSQAAPRICP